MIAVEICFTAGQYHATPWGRHVNEGEVEWPPSPWRILRSLIAVWYRKANTKEFTYDDLESLVMTLTASLPVYHLPEAVQSHTRHYMPGGKPGATTLIFDAFARVSNEDKLVVAWPEVKLTDRKLNLLVHLVDRLAYLGRAESWVEAKVVHNWQGSFNCFPSGDWETIAADGAQAVPTPCPQTPEDFSQWRTEYNPSQSSGWMPDTIVEALSVDTGLLQKSKWSSAPGLRNVVYSRPQHHLSQGAFRRGQNPAVQEVNFARFALSGKPLPKFTEAVMIGELLHLALMGQGGTDVPAMIAGRDANHEVLKAGHRHGFCLPEDDDGDGHIDHLLFVSSDAFPESVMLAIEELADRRKLYTPSHWPGRRREWRLFLETMGNSNHSDKWSKEIALFARSSTWRSATPYLFPWHTRKNGQFGPSEQIIKEFRQRGLPEPTEVDLIRDIPVGTSTASRIRGSQRLTPSRFRRTRVSRKVHRSPDAYGSFLVLKFKEPISGPLAFGYACHFGLGMFVPLQETGLIKSSDV